MYVQWQLPILNLQDYKLTHFICYFTCALLITFSIFCLLLFSFLFLMQRFQWTLYWFYLSHSSIKWILKEHARSELCKPNTYFFTLLTDTADFSESSTILKGRRGVEKLKVVVYFLCVYNQVLLKSFTIMIFKIVDQRGQFSLCDKTLKLSICFLDNCLYFPLTFRISLDLHSRIAM